MKVTAHTDYKSYLKCELEDRLKKNPHYSLRSFADALDISPSHLSRVLNGVKRLSLSSAGKISQRLNHNAKETTHLFDLIQLEQVKDDEMKAVIFDRISKNVGTGREKVLTAEHFKIISEWYHFAILALTKLKTFQVDPRWIAKQLGISVINAKMALERLLDLELLENKNGKIKAVEDANIATSDDLSSAAIKKNHKQNIERSLIALHTQELSEREFGNCAISIKKKDVKKAKKIIRETIRQLNEELDTEQGDDVYQLNVQFFKITDNKRLLR